MVNLMQIFVLEDGWYFGWQLSRQHLDRQYFGFTPDHQITILSCAFEYSGKFSNCFVSAKANFPAPWKPKKTFHLPALVAAFWSTHQALMCCLPSYPWFFIDLLIRMTLWLPTSTQAELLGPPIWWYKQERDKYLVRFLVKLRAALPLFTSALFRPSFLGSILAHRLN